MILDKFPSTEEFYATYWGKKPFVVRGAVETAIFEDLIDGDMLAGLAMEEDIKSRIVVTSPDTGACKCHHGPFVESRFSELGEKNWCLLVQNVEQYHTETAKLLKYFHFSPRWLMDDIMVSCSAAGGTVGPHTDSYHVFLVQGMGKRDWKISYDPVIGQGHIEGMDLKVLQDDYEGETVTVGMGDVIYIPPHFAHSGVTVEEALTFSVGFLCPKISEMMVEYGHYLEGLDLQEARYCGDGLDAGSSGFSMGGATVRAIQNDLVQTLQSSDFSIWLARYFSTPTHDEVGNIMPREHPLSDTDLMKALEEGCILYRPEHVKIAITPAAEGVLNLAVYGESIDISAAHEVLLTWLNDYCEISLQDIESLGDRDEMMGIIMKLYHLNVLDFL